MWDGDASARELRVNAARKSRLTNAAIITVVLIGSICVGIGEELFFRGILLTALRAHHSEFLALIVSSVLFGIAHVVGYLVAGLPLGLILFQVAFLSMNGALFYAARRATAMLWVPMVLHGLNNAALFLQTSGRSDQAPDTRGTTSLRWQRTRKNRR